MTDAPNRTIAGLTPRATPDLSRMQKRNRAAQPLDASETAEQTPVTPTPSKAPAARKSRATAKQTPPTGTANDRVNAYAPAALLERAKATFKATRNFEGDASWSDYVASALLAETQRREAQYNAGESYPSDGARLPAGRPLR
jgi:hypothetical protein